MGKILLILSLIVNFSCAHENTKTSDEFKDEVIEVIKEPLSKDSTTFMSYFQKALASNQKVRIPYNVFENTVKGKFTSPYYTERVNAITATTINNDLRGVLYSIDCTGGGYCIEYFFATTNENEIVIDNKLIGLDASELYKEKEFSYTIKSAELISITQLVQELNDDDEVVKEYREESLLKVLSNGKILIDEIKKM